PGLMANTFVLESFMDELAHKAGKDPVEFRIAHLNDEGKELRLKNVIKAAAEKAGWGKPLPKGHALGLATCAEIGATTAEIAEVSIENGEIKVHKVTCAIDVGVAINPDGIRSQVEGAIIQGFSACMYEKMELEGGKIVPTIFGPYKIATLKEAPREIEVVILESGDRPVGVGEPPVGPIGAAIGNAVFAATGIRLRNLPLSDDFAANQG
ncbi:MAG: molybdopterin cofactor-binding domain-containing protein, partial [Bacteroidota bacterium]